MKNINLIKARKRMGYTQSTVAFLAKISRASYSAYENMRTTPELYPAIRIAKVLKTNPLELFDNPEIEFTEEEFQDYCIDHYNKQGYQD